MSWTWLVPVLNLLKGVKWYWIVIIFLVIVILLQRACQPEPTREETIIYDTDTITITDTIERTIEIYRPEVVYQDTGSTKWLQHSVDTNAILKDYFTAFFYRDTIQDDSNALIVLSDVLYANRIKSRSKAITLYDKTIYVHTVEKYKPRVKIYVGFGVGYGWRYAKPSFTANLILATKSDAMYGVNYDFLNEAVNVSMYWKIRLRR